MDAANEGSDRADTAREGPTGTAKDSGAAKEIGTAKEVGTFGKAGTAKEGDTFGSGATLNTASGLDKTGPRVGSTGLRGSAGVVVVGNTAFTVEPATGFSTPADRRTLIGDSTGPGGNKRFAIGFAIELGETIGGSTGASGEN